MNHNNSSKKQIRIRCQNLKLLKHGLGGTVTQAKALYEQWEVIALAGQVRWASNKDCAFIQLRQRMGHFNITIVGWKRPDYLLQNSNEVSAVLETL